MRVEIIGNREVKFDKIDATKPIVIFIASQKPFSHPVI